MNFVKLIISLALPLGVGLVAGLFTSKAVPEWYATLNRPAIAPPSWVFGPVWTFLYLLMGISFYMIWIQPQSDLRSIAMILFLVQLLLNFAWSFLFFYYKQIGWALAEIIVLWIAILVMLIFFYKVKPLASFLNILYILWVSFATVLNAAYYKVN